MLLSSTEVNTLYQNGKHPALYEFLQITAQILLWVAVYFGLLMFSFGNVPSCMFVVGIQHQILNAIRSLQFPIKDTLTGTDRKFRHTMAVGA